MPSSKKTSSKNGAFKKLHPFIILGYLWPSIWPHALSFNTTCSSVSLLRRPSPTLPSTSSSSTIKPHSQMLDFTYYPFRDSILQHYEGRKLVFVEFYDISSILNSYAPTCNRVWFSEKGLLQWFRDSRSSWFASEGSWEFLRIDDYGKLLHLL